MLAERRLRSIQAYPRSPDRLAKLPGYPRSILPRWDLEPECCSQGHPTGRRHSALMTADGAAAGVDVTF